MVPKSKLNWNHESIKIINKHDTKKKKQNIIAPSEWISLAGKNLSIKEIKTIFVRVHRLIATEKLNLRKLTKSNLNQSIKLSINEIGGSAINQ